MNNKWNFKSEEVTWLPATAGYTLSCYFSATLFVSDYKSNSELTASPRWLSSTGSDQGGGSPVASLLQHGEAVQRGGDVLRADARQLAELPYGDLAVADLVEAL